MCGVVREIIGSIACTIVLFIHICVSCIVGVNYVHAGIQDLPTIQANVREAIDGKMSLFCLGFGDDVDYSFLDVMAQQNKGLARRIYEASDATAQLQVQ